MLGRGRRPSLEQPGGAEVPMKGKELRSIAVCASCGNKIGASGIPVFTRIRIQRFGLNLKALQEQDGLAAAVGSTIVAQAMGSDQDMAMSLTDEVLASICSGCEQIPVVIAEVHEVAGRMAEHAGEPSR